ncbi:CTP:molybdopterin cytidylyltransferase MocA [Albidovulum inexpectatum]|uniref:CTP:molybdopterin cytidylyltransferase MocA n=1 Tax=Albidovulum inexpectatum TaxID=196587 RepID=A0A2S5JJF8_9RHOB|nr:nucleotidyltransferase family protein [Albidovulum inexpectatum]PPB81508.1 CTP:molybdopterin cytidylyltransferase MocA [Albidovulum inexpectatum]
MPDVVILIPAAGKSSRMHGHDKLTVEIDGRPLLARAAAAARATGAEVIVTLPAAGPHMATRRAALAGLDVRVVQINDFQDGMSASLRAGVAIAGSAEGLMVHLPDMPELTTQDLRRVISAFASNPNRPVRGAEETGRPGHPVILPRRLFQEISVLAGDCGAARVLQGENVLLVPLPGRHATTDLDTEDDFKRWFSRRQDQA